MYHNEYAYPGSYNGQRSPPAATQRAEHPPNRGFGSGSQFSPGDPGGFVLPPPNSSMSSDGGFYSQHMAANHCDPSPLGFIMPGEHVGHNHGQQQQPHRHNSWNSSGYQQPPPLPPQGGPGGFVIPGSGPAPSIYQQPQMAYPPIHQQLHQHQQYSQQQPHMAHAYSPNAGYYAHSPPPPLPARGTSQHPPPYSTRDPYATPSDVSRTSTAVSHADRSRHRDNLPPHSRPESVASRISATSSHQTINPHTSTHGQAYASSSQIGMSVYNKHQQRQAAAYTWEDMRHNN
ncbi:hypothetical protein GGI04_002806 [Coemansia thaxteri]|nr:hypothetical protein GGI04_002806 [Coemansia thaxteri]KAJ2473345.1 hypothetical protein GGI02_000928 [Coemansia sp. RSA 2322]KAJ2477723.1 hypothetical protein EV174_004530 [Coemansia sp. RSA 2320]